MDSFQVLVACICAMVLVCNGLLFAEEGRREVLDKAFFAGGCFWCMQEALDKVDGVEETTVGFIGGEEENPSYQQVSKGETGHLEAIEVIYNPSIVSYEQLLDVFWNNIDPTVKGQQFCDVGEQYRSAIFPANTKQKEEALASKRKIETMVPVVYTEIIDATPFYPAEEYHQKFYQKNPVRYRVYKYWCGRSQRLEDIWKKK